MWRKCKTGKGALNVKGLVCGNDVFSIIPGKNSGADG
jgi:hypothetical protein